MSTLRVASVDFEAPPSGGESSGEARVRVGIEGTRESVFTAATFNRPEAWTTSRKGGFWFAEPTLFVRRLDAATVRAAVDAMAADLSGFWLRYYRAAPGAPSKIGLGTAFVDRVEGGCGVAEAVLKDGREFSMLAATPAWWRAELERRALAFYFGPQVLFLSRMDVAHARAAAKAMAAHDEQLFCRYDTPRKTLPEVLDAFCASPR